MQPVKLTIGSTVVALLFAVTVADAQTQRGAGPTSTRSAPRGSPYVGGQSANAPRRFSPSYGGSVGSAGGGITGGRLSGAPRRQVRRNSSPVLSPYLNLDPTFQQSEAGQYLMRVLPQQEYSRTTGQTQQGLQSLQGAIGQTDQEIKSGLGTTGHATSFGNTSGYYPAR
ncbi:MAG: hypothetical protein EXS05_09480 [Planctomycetaceae bacterium]|nr:hypothetical protein [Planctomycetaceae bacterium]